MTIGASLFLIAVGAILRFAVQTKSTHGIDLHTIGDILMIIGVVGLLLWLLLWGPWARGRRTSPRRPPQDVEPSPDPYRPGPVDGRYPPDQYRPREYGPGEYRTEEFPAGEYPTQPEVGRDVRRNGG
jgi:hypothetical protein